MHPDANVVHTTAEMQVHRHTLIHTVPALLTLVVFELEISDRRLCSRQQQQQQAGSENCSVCGRAQRGPLHRNVTVSSELLTSCNASKQSKNNTAVTADLVENGSRNQFVLLTLEFYGPI